MSPTKIMHICKHHGELTRDQVYINRKLIRSDGTFTTMCRACTKETTKKSMRKYTATLSDTYVKRLLTQHVKGLKGKAIPNELIELKRAQLELKRLKVEKEKIELEQWIREQFLNSNSKLEEQT